ncbi:MAG: MBL fold metallo-hydrolase [Cyclobacteriaceae bacterium]
MKVKQFYDEALAHGSYAIVSNKEVALVDPGRDPQPYLDFAQENDAKIVAVFETHPHADFVSSHLEFYQKHGAKIYINSKVGVSYRHEEMNDGAEVKIGNITLRALFTPGHSPDHNTYMLLDEAGNPHSVYTGDSLFVGDVGRPDLREGAGHLRAEREELARQMYYTINDVFKNIEDGVVVYPAHGAGSLCG